MMDMFGKVKEFQNRLKEAQASLHTITESGESGAGMVRVTVNGHKQVVKLEIDADLIRPDDREMLQDLVIAATNKALGTVEDKIKSHLQKATEGLIPAIPGFDLGNLMS